jgi:hypothetical protein
MDPPVWSSHRALLPASLKLLTCTCMVDAQLSRHTRHIHTLTVASQRHRSPSVILPRASQTIAALSPRRAFHCLPLWAPPTPSLRTEAHDASPQRPHAPEPACLARPRTRPHERRCESLRGPPIASSRNSIAPQHRCARPCVACLRHGRSHASRPPCLDRPIKSPWLDAREERLWAPPSRHRERRRRRQR